ncbi:MAG: hypothetical protein ABSB00_02685 [Minisyncoccia bacterium]
MDKVSVGEHNIAVGVMCPNDARGFGLLSWSLWMLQEQKDACGQGPLIAGLYTALHRMKVRKAYAPNVAASSTNITEAEALKKRIRLGENAFLYRDNSVLADGIIIPNGDACAISGTDPVIIAAGGGCVVIAGAGLHSLIDYNMVVSGQTRRQHVTIIHSIIEEFLKRGIRDIEMCMMFSTPAETLEYRFDEKGMGMYNQTLHKFIKQQWPSGVITRGKSSMFLDLESLFKEQAYEAGIEKVRSKYPLDKYPAMADMRDKKQNLVVIKRCS